MTGPDQQQVRAHKPGAHAAHLTHLPDGCLRGKRTASVRASTPGGRALPPRKADTGTYWRSLRRTPEKLLGRAS